MQQIIFDLETPILLSLNMLQILYIIFGVVFFVFLILAIAHKIKKKWQSTSYIALCSVFLLWIFALMMYTSVKGDPTAYNLLAISVASFIPALIYFHTRKQLHYKKIHPVFVALHLACPLVYSVTIVMQVIRPDSQLALSLEPFYWLRPFYFVFSGWAFIRSFVLCIGVFFQMPRHMRISSAYMITALISGGIFVYLPYFTWFETINIIRMIFAIITAGLLFHSLSVISSWNVIVTSRDFVFESLPTTVLVLSRENRILDWNHKKNNRVMNLPEPEYRETLDKYKNRILKERRGKVTQYSEDTITIVQDGAERHLTFTSHKVEHSGVHYGYTFVITDITDVYSVFRDLEDMALYDQLTGLYSRNGYMVNVREIIRENRVPLAIIVGDVNGLKAVNDETGHLAGDSLLKTVANAISASLPEHGIAARVGGDEFVILLPYRDGEDPEEIAKTTIKRINTECDAIKDDQREQPNVSWGYAVMKNADEDYNSVFEKADRMMYSEKKKHFNFRSSGILPDHIKRNAQSGKR